MSQSQYLIYNMRSQIHCIICISLKFSFDVGDKFRPFKFFLLSGAPAFLGSTYLNAQLGCIVSLLFEPTESQCILYNSVSSVVKFIRWWVLKWKILAQELICSKEIVLKQSCNELWFIKNAEIVLSKSIFYVKNRQKFFKKTIHLRITI